MDMDSSDSSVTNEMEDDVADADVAQRDRERGSRSSATSQQNAGASLNDSVSAVFDMRKDDRYWERRRKNNEAAKRSREKRRMNDIVMEKRIVELSTENTRLRTEIERLRRLYNISEADVKAALGSNACAPHANGPPPPASPANCRSTLSESNPLPNSLASNPNRKRRSANGEPGLGPRRATANGVRRSHTLVDASSDASSATSNDQVALTPRSLSGDQLSRSTSVHSHTQSAPPPAPAPAPTPATAPAPAPVTKRRPTDVKPVVINEPLIADAHQMALGAPSSSPSVDAAAAAAAAANGNANVSVPDLVTMLGMLQNIPLLQALLKGNQPQQPAANALPIIQQLAVLQQLCGLNGGLLTGQSNSASALPSTGHSQSSAGSSSATQRSATALDLRCKPSTLAPSEGVQLASENRTLRVELDQINAQVRELKEILLQRGVSLALTGDAKRQNAGTAAVDELSTEAGHFAVASCSKRSSKRSELHDANSTN